MAIGRSDSPAVREALGQLASAFAVLAGGGGAGASQAVRHAIRARALVTGTVLAADTEQTSGPRSQLVVRLVETCADDTLRLTGRGDDTAPADDRGPEPAQSGG
jgi:ribosomal protein S9